MPSKQYPVIDAQSAIANHNKQLSGFKEIQSRISQANAARLIVPTNDGQPTLDDFLAQNRIPQTFAAKNAMAKKVGISNYTGKPEQDKQIMMAMQSIDAKENETKGKEGDAKNKDREFGLKEKELALKEKEIAAKQMPGASEIADQLMNKFNQNK